MPGIYRRQWWFGRRGLSSGSMDTYGGGSPPVSSACSGSSGQTATLNFLNQVGSQANWLSPTGTFRGLEYYVTLTCGVAGMGAWQAIITFPSTGIGFTGTVTETSPGIWTVLIQNINVGDGCIYQLAGSWAEADCT